MKQDVLSLIFHVIFLHVSNMMIYAFFKGLKIALGGIFIMPSRNIQVIDEIL